MPEYVILINEKNEPIGKALKSKVHTDDTPLHRAFSIFLFNRRGELLLAQRSRHKITWPLIWSNSCCGHPIPGEKTIDAARRRLNEELGIKIDNLREMLPDFRYKAEMNGIVENEICPVFTAVTDATPSINPNEVEAIKWVSWKKFRSSANTIKPPLSPWCVEETGLLNKSEKFQKWHADNLRS